MFYYFFETFETAKNSSFNYVMCEIALPNIWTNYKNACEYG